MLETARLRTPNGPGGRGCEILEIAHRGHSRCDESAAAAASVIVKMLQYYL